MSDAINDAARKLVAITEKPCWQKATGLVRALLKEDNIVCVSARCYGRLVEAVNAEYRKALQEDIEDDGHITLYPAPDKVQ